MPEAPEFKRPETVPTGSAQFAGTLRQLVMPELVRIMGKLDAIEKRLDVIEKTIDVATVRGTKTARNKKA